MAPSLGTTALKEGDTHMPFSATSHPFFSTHLLGKNLEGAMPQPLQGKVLAVSEECQLKNKDGVRRDYACHWQHSVASQINLHGGSFCFLFCHFKSSSLVLFPGEINIDDSVHPILDLLYIKAPRFRMPERRMSWILSSLNLYLSVRCPKTLCCL